MKIFIPIKEVSQRVPGKNFREFRNQELYRYVINKLRQQTYIDSDNLNYKKFEIYVNTDSKSVLDWCENEKNIYGIKRKEEHIGHDVSVNVLIEDFITSYNVSDIVCQTHVTSPLLEPSTIIGGYHYMKKEYDSVVGCDIIYNRFWENKNGKMIPINHNPKKLIQTQDLDPLYLENSSFYMFDSQTFMKTKNRIGDNPYFYEVKYPQNLDIDTEEDWDLIKKFE